MTANDPALTARDAADAPPRGRRGKLIEGLPMTGAEDFSFFAREIPGLFVFLGVRTPKGSRGVGVPNHSPRFRPTRQG